MSIVAASIVILAIIAGVALAGLTRVPEGQVYSVRRFRGASRLLMPGLYVLAPLIDRIVHKISLTGHTLSVEAPLPQTGGATRRMVHGRVYWQVLEPDRADAVIDRADELIQRRALDAFCACDDPDNEPCLARNARLKQALNQSLRPRGMLITRVDLSLAA